MSKAKLGPEEFKVVVLGDKGVGKTSLVMRYIEGYFSENQQSTVGAFFLTKKVTVKGKAMKMQLWDTAGQERFRSLAPMYYRSAHAAIVCYDKTDEESFIKAQNWVQELRQNIPISSSKDIANGGKGDKFDSSPIFLIIVCTKCDRPDSERIVSQSRGEEFATKCNASYMETSAQEDIGIKETFSLISEHVYASFERSGVFEEDLPSEAERGSFVITANRNRKTSTDSSSDSGNGNGGGGCC